MNRTYRPFASIGSVALVAVIGCSSPCNCPNDPFTPEQDPEIRALLDEQLRIAVELHANEEKRMELGSSSPQDVAESSERLTSAKIAAARTPEEKLAALAERVEHAKEAQATMQRKRQMGTLTTQDASLAEFERLQAEIELARARRSLK